VTGASRPTYPPIADGLRAVMQGDAGVARTGPRQELWYPFQNSPINPISGSNRWENFCHTVSCTMAINPRTSAAVA
jgi:hypothetical protein